LRLPRNVSAFVKPVWAVADNPSIRNKNRVEIDFIGTD